MMDAISFKDLPRSGCVFMFGFVEDTDGNC